MYIKALNFFNELKEIIPKAEMVIAGGFCRDRIFGKEFKDVDIWVDLTYWPDNFQNELERYIDDFVRIENYSHYDNSILEVKSRASFQFEGIEYQIMLYPKDQDSNETYGQWVIGKFDSSLNECFYDSDFNTTEDFDNALAGGPVYIKNASDLDNLVSNIARTVRFLDKLEISDTKIYLHRDLEITFKNNKEKKSRYRGLYRGLDPFEVNVEQPEEEPEDVGNIPMVNPGEPHIAGRFGGLGNRPRAIREEIPEGLEGPRENPLALGWARPIGADVGRPLGERVDRPDVNAAGIGEQLEVARQRFVDDAEARRELRNRDRAANAAQFNQRNAFQRAVDAIRGANNEGENNE